MDRAPGSGFRCEMLGPEGYTGCAAAGTGTAGAGTGTGTGYRMLLG